MNRLEKLTGQLAPQTTSAKRDDDVVIVSALRTPIGRARKGYFKDSFVEDLLAPCLKAVIEETQIDPKIIGDIVVGTVLGKNVQRANEVRIAAFMAGIPDTVPIHIINRQCSSGLQALAHVAGAIKAGYYDCGLASGVEVMSKAQMGWAGGINPKIFMDPKTKACLLPMGITSENVAKLGGVTREEQDQMAVASNARAAEATDSGRFKREMVPMRVRIKDRKTGKVSEVVVDKDEGIRRGTSMQSLAKLKTVFMPKGGTTTAGNASQVSDGAAAVLAMKRSLANQLGLKILGTFRGFSVAGVPPHIMGIGPVPAIRKVLKQTNLTIGDIDLFEVNEAFASQAVYCVKELGIDMRKCNVNGGAIAIGHPLGATGCRMTATLLHEMARRGDKLGVVSMCIGSGMGAAAVFERD